MNAPVGRCGAKLGTINHASLPLSVPMVWTACVQPHGHGHDYDLVVGSSTWELRSHPPQSQWPGPGAGAGAR